MKKSIILLTIKEILLEAKEGLTSKREKYEPDIPLLYQNVYEPEPVVYYVDIPNKNKNTLKNNVFFA